MKKIVCNSCGTKNNRNNAFCSKCGADLSAQENENFQIGEAVENNGVIVREKSKSKILPIIICIVLIIAAIFAALKLINANGTKEKGYAVNMFNDGLVPYRSGEKYGYLDMNGDSVINPQFDSVSDFSEGLACVGIKSGDDIKYGYIDTSGNYIIDTQYDSAYDFIDGIAFVATGDYWGVIDREGKYIINPQYTDSQIEYVGNGMFLILDSSGDYANLTDLNGNKISETRFSKVYFSLPILSLYYYFKKSDSDLIPLRTISDKRCYIDSEGKTVIDAQFDDASNFFDGLACIGMRQGSGDNSKTKYGYIDESGNIVINPQFDSAGHFSEGMAYFGMGNSESGYTYGYIDKNGKYVINPQYDYAYSFKNGRAIVEKHDSDEVSKYGMIDKDGNIIMEIKYDELSNDYDSGYVLFKSDGKYGYADYDGTVKISSRYPWASPFTSDGYAVVATENKQFAIIVKKGNQLWDKLFDGVGNTDFDSLIYEFCKIDGCYNWGWAPEGYCIDHYYEFED